MSEPHWTTTPPTEPGWWWMRNRGCAGVVQLVCDCGDVVFAVTGLKTWTMPIGTEWWPVPIPEPPRGDEP